MLFPAAEARTTIARSVIPPADNGAGRTFDQTICGTHHN